MHDYWPTVIARQFAATIQMLRSAVEACPDHLWDERAYGTPFWQLCYHALFYTDFYLSDDANTLPNFLPGDQQFGGLVTTPGTAFTRAQLLDYADHCLRKSDETFHRLTDKRAIERCGFPWYQLHVGEFLLNNLRHTQHHTGQLIVLLRRHAGIGIGWLGTRDDQQPLPTW